MYGLTGGASAGNWSPASPDGLLPLGGAPPVWASDPGVASFMSQATDVRAAAPIDSARKRAIEVNIRGRGGWVPGDRVTRHPTARGGPFILHFLTRRVERRATQLGSARSLVAHPGHEGERSADDGHARSDQMDRMEARAAFDDLAAQPRGEGRRQLKTGRVQRDPQRRGGAGDRAERVRFS